MQSLWNDAEAQDYINSVAGKVPEGLALRVYTSRLLGRNSALVLHGGGNTSVKSTHINLFGEEESLLYVKGSGWDLETIQPQGFSPTRMDALLKLATLKELSDLEMANQLRLAMIDVSAPSPSVEAILHAILPFKFVDHTHADATIAIMNNPRGREIIQEIYGDEMVFVPYIMPGFKLARLCAEALEAQLHEGTKGMMLFNHGIFTWGETARESYEMMITQVSKAEAYIEQHSTPISSPQTSPEQSPKRAEIAALRREISSAAGFPVLLYTQSDAPAMAYVQHEAMPQFAGQGPLTPDHVIRTKRLPLIGRDVADYVAKYRAYFDEFSKLSSVPLTMLDPAPRMVLDPALGVISVGRTAKDTRIANDIYNHTMTVIQQAEGLGGFRALPAGDLFELEYWDLEQAKLRAGGKPAPFAGEVALVTGAATGIGKACVESLLARGAAVVALDINPAIETLFKRPDYLGVVCDVTDEAQLADVLEQTVLRFGGLDMLVLNAGIFPAGTHIRNLALDEWNKVMRVNLDANLSLMREAHPLLKLAYRGGKVVVIASKNVPAPGPGASAYSASKAALTQLARVAALEWGQDGIRVNIVHPNAVFDTGLWTDEVLAARAQHYGLTVEEYKTNNILKVEVTSHDVSELVADLCTSTFARTTGAQIPVDGGNDRVI